LAKVEIDRALARQQRDDRDGACADARQAESLWSELVRGFGEGPWSSLAPRAAALCKEVCGSPPKARPTTGWLARLGGFMRR
jgi:hypothetical protein